MVVVVAISSYAISTDGKFSMSLAVNKQSCGCFMHILYTILTLHNRLKKKNPLFNCVVHVRSFFLFFGAIASQHQKQTFHRRNGRGENNGKKRKWDDIFVIRWRLTLIKTASYKAIDCADTIFHSFRLANGLKSALD